MNKHARYGIALAALLATAATSGCTNKAEAQTPPAPTRMLTADTDVNQLMSGAATATAPSGQGSQFQKVVDGPFVLTDLGFTGNGLLYALPAGQDCTVSNPVETLDGTNGRFIPFNGPIVGARIVIKAGEELCASWSTGVTRTGFSWSGFKPY